MKLPLAGYIRLLRLDKPIGIYLLLWPTLWGLLLATEGSPPLSLLLIFTLGTVLMRSAGCAINDFADRYIDGSVARTAHRPLATGEVTPREALLLAALLALLALLLIQPLNQLTLLLSLPAVVVATLYPFTKRFTSMPQAVLGIAFAMGVPMSFAAAQDRVPPESWWLFAAVVCWAIAYDTMYAMTDRADDLKIGVKSSAILFGRWDRLAVGLFQGLTYCALLMSAILFHRSNLYFVILTLLSLGFFGYQQWLIRHRDPAACFQAFLNNHYYGLGVLLALLWDLRSGA